jgi:hypothetical protein
MTVMSALRAKDQVLSVLNETGRRENIRGH